MRALIAMVLLSGCGGLNTGDAGTDASTDAGAGAALFADVVFTLRCDAAGGCAGPERVDICGFTGSESCGTGAPVSGTCQATPDGPLMIIDFDMHIESGGLEIASLTVPAGGGVVSGSACNVTVTDSAGTMRTGACGGLGTGLPCEIWNVEIYDDMGNPTVAGEIWCTRLGTGIEERELTGPTASEPGTFRIANCAGLSL